MRNGLTSARPEGIYTALSPNTSMGYARDSKWMVCCLGMKGITNTHSTEGGGVVIFRTKEQLIPRFLIEYQ
jgi:hypothetical protein